MEKTNELNKFLSYIHMGNSVFRIYHKECENLKDEKLLGIIEEIEEKHVAGCGISMRVSPVYFSCEGKSGRDTD